MIGKIFFYIGKNPNKARISQTRLVVPNPVAGSGVGTAPGKFCNFCPHLNWETVFPAFMLTQNCYMNKNFSFS